MQQDDSMGESPPLYIGAEWEPAPGVKDKLLAATWARLIVSSKEVDLTLVRVKGTDNYRNFLYTSAWPIAKWLVDNWYWILYDSTPLDVGWSDPNWRGNHCLTSASEGLAVPNVVFRRDGRFVNVRWFATTDSLLLEFMNYGQEWITVSDFTAAITEFVEATFSRIYSVHLEDPDGGTWSDESRDVFQKWNEILVASEMEHYIQGLVIALYTGYNQFESIDRDIGSFAPKVDLDMMARIDEAVLKRIPSVVNTPDGGAMYGIMDALYQIKRDRRLSFRACMLLVESVDIITRCDFERSLGDYSVRESFVDDLAEIMEMKYG